MPSPEATRGSSTVGNAVAKATVRAARMHVHVVDLYVYMYTMLPCLLAISAHPHSATCSCLGHVSQHSVSMPIAGRCMEGIDL